MASKLPTKKPAQSLAISPLHSLSPAAQLIASEIPLPRRFSVLYAQFSPNALSQQYQDVDSARKLVFESSSTQPLLTSILTHVDVSKAKASLWAFCIDSIETSAAKEQFERLSFQGLYRSDVGKFSYPDIYPCSPTCSERRNPCTGCIAQQPELSSQAVSPETSSNSTPLFSTYSTPNPNNNQSASACLPRRPLRKPHALFLDAVRERVVSDACNTSRDLRRSHCGILMGFVEAHTRWGDGWEQHQRLRTLIYCHIEVSLFPSSILIQPQLKPTQFLPLVMPGLAPGTPINLLPFLSPAYFLNQYTGSTSALKRQFQLSLRGLGAGFWPSNREDNVQFVIAWVNVENKQGEEKGLMVVWPADLCVSVLSFPKSKNESDDRFAYCRKQLVHIPELPAALQSSPIPAPATVPSQRGASPNETKAFHAGPSSADWTATPQNEMSPFTPFSAHPPLQAKLSRPFLAKARSSFFTDLLQSHKALTYTWLRRQNVKRVSVCVGKYVDSVAKERERERERMRKEREAAAAALAQKEQSGLQQSAGSSFAIEPPPTAPQVTNPRLVVQIAPPAPTTPSITVNLQPLAFPSPTQILPIGVQQPQIPLSYPSPPDDLMSTGSSVSHATQQAASLSIPQLPGITQQQSEVENGVDFGDAFGLDKIMTEFNMDFDQNVNSALSGAGQPTSAIDPLHAMDLDLSIFTDDDFNFFDDQTTNALTLAANQSSAGSIPMGTSDPLAGLGISSVFSNESNTPGLYTASMIPTDTQGSPWSPSKFDEVFNSSISAFNASFPDQQLVPTSPDRSASSISGPTTPDVLCMTDIATVQDWPSSGDEPFNAITFPDGIRKVDHKYQSGKFVMQLEGNIMDVDQPSSYADATDPRKGIVRKLIGRRKKYPQECRNIPILSPSYDEHLEWFSNADEDMSDASSASEHESEGESSFEDEVMAASRPSTPLPSNLPLGPSLIATRFSHSALLPLSTNLRPPGAPFPISDLASPAPNPVPTPVSPAAILGAASEKSKSLESAARMLCRESVENAVWLEAWRTNAVSTQGISDLQESFTSEYLRKRDMNLGSLSIERICNIASLHRPLAGLATTTQDITAIQQPQFSVGKSDAVITVSPPAIAFWDKLGLCPRSGPKDVVAFALLQGNEEMQEQLEDWIKRISLCYSRKGFGSHTLGNARMSGKDGLLPVNFESFRKSLSSFIESLDTGSSSFLFYVVVPASSLNLGSLTLRQILSGLRRALSGPNGKRLHFHFIPETLFTQSDDYDFALSIEATAMSVYDRINRPMQRMVTRTLGDGHDILTATFASPAVTLARSSLPAVSITYKYPLTDAGSFDRHTILHVGYRFSRCRKWLMSACIDMRGESNDVGLWLVQEEHDYKQIISHLWEFALEFVRRAKIEWRVVFTKYGGMGEEELEAWNHHFSADTPFGDLPLHTSVTCLEDDVGWLFLPETLSKFQHHNSPGGGDTHKGQQLITSTSTTFILPHLLRIPMASASEIDLFASRNFIPDEGGDDPLPSEHASVAVRDRDGSRLRPLQTGVLITVSPKPIQAQPTIRTSYIHLMGTYASPSSTFTKPDTEHHMDILRNYHDLTVLTQARWQRHNARSNASLPFHISALRIMEETLAQNSSNNSVIDLS